VKPKDLPTFSGKSMDWAQWKDQSLAVFKICGLYELIESREFADSHPRGNTTVHGLLVNVLASTPNVSYCCIDTEFAKSDGHGSWKRLEAIFEREELVELLLETQYETFTKLVLDPTVPLDKFIGDFMSCRNRILQYKKWCRDMGYTPRRAPNMDWKKEFLAKTKDPKYNTKKETCDVNSNIDLEGTIIKYRVVEFEYQRTHNGMEPKKNNGKPKQVSDDVHTTKKGATMNQQGTYTHTVAQLYTAVGDDEEMKLALKSILAKAKEGKPMGNKGNGKKRTRFEKNHPSKTAKRRTTSTAHADDDARANLPVNEELVEYFAAHNSD
jgi:hypothetical protein